MIQRQTVETDLPDGHHARFAMTKHHVVLDVDGKIAIAFGGRWISKTEAASLALSILEVLR